MWDYDPQDFWGPLFPQETAVPLLMNTVAPLCAEDSRRVYLMIAASSTQGVNVSTKSTVGAASGKVVNNAGAGPLELTFADAGPLCGMAWFGFSAVATTITVFELLRIYAPAARQKTNQRGEEDEASIAQENADRDNRYGITPTKSAPYRAHFLGPLSRRLRDQLHGRSYTWQWDKDSGGYYPADPDAGDGR